ncbi:methyltransferase domain-containing protein, partial [bacterium]|nr:methyltransferase domain-containing protein [bacterium]
KRKQKKTDSWYDSFIAAMHNRASMTAPAIVSQLDLTGVNNVLDVGGGSGAFSIQFVKQNRDLVATVFDLPHVVKMTQTYVEKAGVSGRVRYTGGDYMKDKDLGSGYDLVFLSAIIHSNSPEINKKLFKKCYSALNSGGRVVVQDFIMDDSRTTPAMGAVFALNMLVGTPEGDSYTKSEISDWLTEAGFKEISQLAPIGPTSSVIARK